MVESTCFQHTSSHPDKYNNSVDRIISKEEEREDPRRDSSIYLRVQNTVVFPHFYKISSNTVYSTVFPHAIQQLQDILHTELILLQEFSKKYYNYKAHPVQITTRHLPATVPVSPSILHGRIKLPGSLTSIPGPYSTSRLPAILPCRNSILSGSQHPHNPYSSSQVHYYRILPGEIGFTPKGLSIVCPCNTKVSVFQFAYSYFRIILQEI